MYGVYDNKLLLRVYSNTRFGGAVPLGLARTRWPLPRARLPSSLVHT